MKKWSEEEIGKAIRHFIISDEEFLVSFIQGQSCCIEKMTILEAAINELLTLRRRLEDKNRIMNLIVKNCDEYGNGDNEPHKAADAIIKYLTEGSDGE